MRIDHQKMVSVSLMSLGVALLLYTGAGIGSCAPLRTGVALNGNLGFADDITEQGDRAVHIQMNCDGKVWRSSGVAIGGSRVMTAAHSVTVEPQHWITRLYHKVVNQVTEDCEAALWVTTKTGARLWATTTRVDHDNDTAILYADGLDASLVRVGHPPSDNSIVCAATAHPIRGRICGSVAYTRPTHAGVIITGLAVVPGNSGAGVYDLDGALVGVVVTGCKVQGCGMSGTAAVGAEL